MLVNLSSLIIPVYNVCIWLIHCGEKNYTALTTFQGCFFFNYLTDFSYFPLEKNSECFRIQAEQVKNDLFERGRIWFQLFYIDFQLF